MDILWPLFWFGFLLILEYRILRGLWDARRRNDWERQAREIWKSNFGTFEPGEPSARD